VPITEPGETAAVMMGALATATARMETAVDEEAVTRAELEPQVA
jgi:hypothetical protein